ncbi:MAG: YgjV family protein [Patescibacteria group bacterium]|nr:YgjV family protein [Patescibacteria group bacterium]MDE2015220.1 YgjV family protein [Patescibacteria group bacterium]MDE2227026.1 YgjV family protein [Patescibacteria group bacterium]
MIFTFLGTLGLIAASIAIWIRDERKQDVLFIVGGIFLLAYSINIGNIIFIILQIVFIISASSELIKLNKKIM